MEACPACSSTAAETWRIDCRDWQQESSPDRFEYKRCGRCGTCFLAERPLESELGKLYFAGYGPYQAVPEMAVRPPESHPVARALSVPLYLAGTAVGLLARRRLSRELGRFYVPRVEHESLLDWGCGTPAFLEWGRERGYSTRGVDFSPDVVRTVRASGHQAFVIGEELENNVADGSIDCVRMNHVVEHLYRPWGALSTIFRKMAPGGRIHIATPNPAGVGSRLFGRRWHALDCPRHVVLYRPPILKRLLEESGFQDISIHQEVASQDLARSWGIVLYERGLIRHGEIAAMRTDITRLRLFLPLASLGALFSAADRFHLFARRA